MVVSDVLLPRSNRFKVRYKREPNVMPQDDSQPRYIYAYDPYLKRRVPFVVQNGIATSTSTGYRFRMSQ